ncbi:Fe(2+) transporter permease subunit FeoB [Zooshikella harenae]|uniref:Ferrous iron transport protein B n=1 Tax=Zooshikella harenae TaxID=2827238 RepID=A0ABS5ZGJ2_9GAMM|nr:Fe(2+) transporter permease subunit FeoB [Zooshikella harenae]MBU2712396.1 Fe(2+) transporter permease subunit FeoB [Zooshikella harenae]
MTVADRSQAKATVCVVGNPNCGKTSLFNALTGARQKVGNWAGVTVEKKTGQYSFNQQTIDLVDLPGTYSLDVIDETVSLDEKIARDYVISNEADLIVNIIDAANFQRNLYLTLQLLEMGKPVLVVLNMMDMLSRDGKQIDCAKLAELLGCPVIPVVASRKKGIIELKQAINDYLASPKSFATTFSFCQPIEQAIEALEPKLAEVSAELSGSISRRWLTLKLLEGELALPVRLDHTTHDLLLRYRAEITESQQEDLDILIANDRYQHIARLAEQTITTTRPASARVSEFIDQAVLNRWLGFPIFLLVMYVMFMFTINIGSAFIDLFDILAGTLFVDGTGYLLSSVSAPDWLNTLLAQGVGGGIQTVATFIPIIGCLFLFLSILEDSGYMARAAFVMDRLMRYLGLPGKSFVPMLIGFGCNVPSVMAARTLENERDRFLTIIMAPFMSCGARLPVYALFAVAFFPDNGQNIVFALYLIGIITAVATGLLMKRTLLPGESVHFIMELPDYHMPSFTSVCIRTWDRLRSFITKAGKMIVMVVMVLSMLNSLGTDGTFGNENTERSLLSQIGQQITPLFKPIGLTEENWPATVGIFTGIFAKEAVVGTLDAMYTQMGSNEAGEEGAEYDLIAGIQEAFATVPANLSDALDTWLDPLGLNIGDTHDKTAAAEEQEVSTSTYSVMQTLFGSSAAAFAYLLFILLYTPCVAAIGAIYRETSGRWSLFVSLWTLLMAYTIAGVYYQMSTFAGHPESSLMWSLGLVIAFLVTLFGMRYYAQSQKDVSSYRAESVVD